MSAPANRVVAVTLMVMMASVFVVWPRTIFAQGEVAGPRQENPIVELTAVGPPTMKKKDKKDTWYLKIVGKAPRLPENTEVEFQVRWRFKSLGKFALVLDDSRRFSKEFELPFISGFAEGIILRAYVRPERQSRVVQEDLEKRPKEFPPDRTHWVETFTAKKVSAPEKSHSYSSLYWPIAVWASARSSSNASARSAAACAFGWVSFGGKWKPVSARYASARPA